MLRFIHSEGEKVERDVHYLQTCKKFEEAGCTEWENEQVGCTERENESKRSVGVQALNLRLLQALLAELTKAFACFTEGKSYTEVWKAEPEQKPPQEGKAILKYEKQRLCRHCYEREKLFRSIKNRTRVRASTRGKIEVKIFGLSG